MRFPTKLMMVMCVWSVTERVAADPSALEEGLPVTVEDAFPIPYMGREFLFIQQYDHLPSGEDELRWDPRIEWGFARNAQLSLDVPFEYLSEPDNLRLRDVELGAFYNFNMETYWLPAFALEAHVSFPTAPDSRGVDHGLKAIMTKTLGSANWMPRIHLNAEWLREAGARSGEREHRFVGVVGWSARLGPDTMLVGDFVYEQTVMENVDEKIVEIGVRQQITPMTLVGIGLGAGIGEDSPDIRVNVGVQTEF